MHGGDVKNVTLVFINHNMDLIIDRFGSDVVVSYHDETHSKVTVPVALSDAFYSGCLLKERRSELLLLKKLLKA